jgi:uncharacterized protein (TIGR00369 family)
MVFDSEDNPCVICGPDNPIGLHVQWTMEPPRASASVIVPEPFQGWRGVVHGGLVAALLDEAMWYAVYGATGQSCYTVELTTRYHQPTQVGAVLTVTGEAGETRHRVTAAQAWVRDAGDGQLLASARGRFMPDRRGG